MKAGQIVVTVISVLLAVAAAADSRAESAGKGVALRHERPAVAVTGHAVAPARVGAPAPRFTMDAVLGKEVKKIDLADYLGKWVVLFFYPNDFSIVCPTEIRGFNDALGSFRELNAEVLGASVDSIWVHKAWIERGDLGDLRFPLLSDITKKVAASYDILDKAAGTALRALFIIDPQGTLQYMVVHNMDVGRNVEETLRVLEALQTGSLCPIGWKKGQKTLGR